MAEPALPAETVRQPSSALEGIPDTTDPCSDVLALLDSLAISDREGLERESCQFAGLKPTKLVGSDVAIFGAGQPVEPPGGNDCGHVPGEKPIVLARLGGGASITSDPYESAKADVAAAALRIICAGGTPRGWASPVPAEGSSTSDATRRTPDRWQGILEAWAKFRFESCGERPPFPVEIVTELIEGQWPTAMAGWVELPEHLITPWFKDEGDAVILLGPLMDPADAWGGLGMGSYLRERRGIQLGAAPVCDLSGVRVLMEAVRCLIYGGRVKSAQACGSGGVALALARSCLGQPGEGSVPGVRGASIDWTSMFANVGQPRMDSMLFGEPHGRVVISTGEFNASKLVAQARILGVQACVIGRVGGSSLQFKLGDGTFDCRLAAVSELPAPTSSELGSQGSS